MGRGHNASLDPIKTNRLPLGLFTSFSLPTFHPATLIPSHADAFLTLPESARPSAASGGLPSLFDAAVSVSIVRLFTYGRHETHVPGLQASCRPPALPSLRRNLLTGRMPRPCASDLSRSLLRKCKTASFPTQRRSENARPNAGLLVSSCNSIFLTVTPECGPGVPSTSPPVPVSAAYCAAPPGLPRRHASPTVVRTPRS